MPIPVSSIHVHLSLPNPSAGLPQSATRPLPTQKTIYTVNSIPSIEAKSRLVADGQKNSECNLTEDQKNAYYDPDTQIWSIDDNVYEELEHDIASVVECTSKNDLVLFSTTKVLVPKRTILIEEKILLSAYDPKIDHFTTDVPETETPVRFTCPTNTNGIFEIGSTDVVFANLAIQDCDVEGDVPVTVNTCETVREYTLTMIFVHFENNVHAKEVGVFRMFDPSCHRMEMFDSIIQGNECDESSATIITGTSSSRIIATRVTAKDNTCTVFMSDNGHIEIYDSIFERNTGGLNPDAEGEFRGGALKFQNGATIGLYSSSFINNTGKYGGSVYAFENTVVSGEDLIFEGNVADMGGAIYSSESKILCDSCTFRNNQAKIRGGAIDLTGGTFASEGLTVMDNVAPLGGGLAFENTEVEIFSGTFTTNIAEGEESHGGGVYLLDVSYFNADDWTCQYNTAVKGGGVYAQGSSLKMKKSIFESNQVTDEGAGLYLEKSDLRGDDLQFQTNEATKGSGLAIHSETIVTLSNSQFNGNIGKEAGAVFLTSKATLNGESLVFKDNVVGSAPVNEGLLLRSLTSMKRNADEGLGAGLTVTGEGSATLTSAQFENNEGFAAGGAVAVIDAALTCKDAITFKSNRAPMAGGIYLQNATADLSDVVFEANEATGTTYGGGALLLVRQSTAKGEQLQFIENHSSKSGGGVAVTGASFSASHSQWISNVADERGAGLAVIGPDNIIELTESEFRSNVATQNGGGMIYDGSGSFVLSNVIFGENKASTGAGMYAKSSVMEMKSMTFTNNNADSEGGGLYAVTTNISVSDSTFDGNTANRGAGLQIQECGKSTLSKITFTKNTAAAEGGGCLVTKSALDAADLMFDGNAANRGAGIYISANVQVKVSKCTFKNNNAKADGGGWYCTKSILTASDLTFAANAANRGAGMYVQENNQSTLSSILFNNNVATGEGGGWYAYKAKAETTDMFFDKNVAEQGAGCFVKESQLSLTHPSFTNNIAKSEGGGLMVSDMKKLVLQNFVLNANQGYSCGGVNVLHSSNVQFTKGNFTKNQADDHGGAFCIETSNAVQFQSVSMESNVGTYGGAAFIKLSQCNIKDATFSKNSALRHGGGINALSATLAISSITFDQNTAHFGGGIYSQESTLSLDSCTFTQNVGKDTGGGLTCLMETNMTGSSLKFLHNRATMGAGAVFSESEGHLIQGEFTENEAEYDGGALSITSESSFYGEDLIIQKNTAEKGAAIFADFRSGVTLKDSTISENKAQKDGSGLFASLTESLRWEDVLFEKNVAGRNGGLYLRDVSNTSFFKTQFLQNVALNGAAMFALNSNVIQTEKCIFSENSATERGAAVYSDDVEFMDNGSEFQSNMAHEGGAVFASKPRSSTWKQTLFDKNSATTNGGAISVVTNMSSSILIVEQSRFYNSHAYQGGALFYKRNEQYRELCFEKSSSESCKPVISIRETEMIGNKAGSSGGIAFLSDPFAFEFTCDASGKTLTLKPLIGGKDANIFCSNWHENNVPSAELKVEEFGTAPTDIIVELGKSDANRYATNEEGVVSLEGVVSGYTLPTMDLKAVDAFGNVLEAAEEDAFWAKLVAPAGFFRTGNEIGIQLIDGEELFADITCIADPGTYNLTLQYGTSEFSDSMTIVVNVAGCPPGMTMGAGGNCEECRAGTYSRGGKCIPCPEDSTCENGYIVPDSRFWHKTPCQPRMNRCLNEEACDNPNRRKDIEAFLDEMDDCDLTNDEVAQYDDILCHNGYHGILCSTCSKDWGTLSGFRCVECVNIGSSIAILIAALVWFGILTSIQVFRYPKRRKQGRIPGRLPSMRTVRSARFEDGIRTRSQTLSQRSTNDLDSPFTAGSTSIMPSIPDTSGARDALLFRKRFSELMKVTMNYLQLCAVLYYLDVNWIPLLRITFEAAASVGGVISLPISFVSDCFLADFIPLHKVIIRFIFAIAAPSVAFIAVTLGGWLSMRFFRSSMTMLQFANLCFMGTLYINYFGITQLAFKMLNCVSVYDSVDFNSDKVTKVLASDSSMVCWEGEHWILVSLSILVLVLVTIGYPILCGAQISSVIMTPQSSSNGCLDFLFYPYSTDFDYWELFVLMRKAVFAAVCVFSITVPGNAMHIVLLMILIVSLVIQASLNPYQKEFTDFNLFETAALFLYTTNVSLAIMIGSENSSELTKEIASYVVSGLNAAFIVLFGYALVQTLRKKQFHWI